MTKNHSPFFSVIINNHNYGRFLKQAIDSVLRQTFTDYELIVVDDASTDISLDILKLYQDHLTLIEMPENRGQMATFNEGILHAKGQFVCFLDADDVFLEYKLEKLHEAIQETPGADLYQHQFYYTDEALQQCFSPLPHSMRSGNLSAFCVKHGMPTYPPTSTCCYKTAFLTNILPIELPLTQASADIPTAILAHLLGTVQSIPQPLMLYRLHGDNVSHATKYRANVDPKALFKRRLIAEKIFLCVNERLQKKGVSTRIDIQKSFVFQCYRYTFGDVNFWYLFFNILKHQQIPRLIEKITFLYTAWCWRKCVYKSPYFSSRSK